MANSMTNSIAKPVSEIFRMNGTRSIPKHGENCLLADPTPSSLAESVEQGLRDGEPRRRIVTTAHLKFASHRNDWDAEIDKIYRYMVRVC